MEINQEIKNKIDDYLLGKMSDQEVHLFEHTMSQDEDLQKEVNQMRLILESIESYGDQKLKNKLNLIHENHLEQTASVKKYQLNKKFISAAASILIIISSYFAYYQFHNINQSPETIYQLYYSTPEFNMASRSHIMEASQTAESYYKIKDYTNAIEELEEYSQNNPEDLSAMFYKAICLHEIELDSSASILLNKIIDNNHPALSDDARWYYSLILLSNHEIGQAKDFLKQLQSDSTSFYSEKANEILKIKMISEYEYKKDY